MNRIVMLITLLISRLILTIRGHFNRKGIPLVFDNASTLTSRPLSDWRSQRKEERRKRRGKQFAIFTLRFSASPRLCVSKKGSENQPGGPEPPIVSRSILQRLTQFDECVCDFYRSLRF